MVVLSYGAVNPSRTTPFMRAFHDGFGCSIHDVKPTENLLGGARSSSGVSPFESLSDRDIQYLAYLHYRQRHWELPQLPGLALQVTQQEIIV